MNGIVTNGSITETIIDYQHEEQLPVSTRPRRLKGLLALLPLTGTLYLGQGKDNDADQTCDSLLNINAAKITSKKQQRRRIKRYCQDELRTSSHLIDVESGTCDDEVKMTDGNVTIPTNVPVLSATPIQLTDLLHDKDIAVLFLFDPYQPYSLQLLQKLFSVCRCSSDSVVHQTRTTDVDNINNHNQSTIHCLVVTPCTDTNFVAGLLKNTDAVLLPWISDDGTSSDYWKIAMGGANVCPSILGIVECSKGRNVFPLNHEELALDWNSAIHVHDAWCHRRTSAFTTIQRIQSYALYPTSSICTIV